MSDPTNETLCPCGCGRPVKTGNRFAALGCQNRMPDNRARVDDRVKASWQRQEVRDRHRVSMEKAWDRSGYRELRSEMAHQQWDRPGCRAKQGVTVRSLWGNQDFRDKAIAGMVKAHANWEKPSSLHADVKAALAEAGITTTTHVPVGYWCIDEADVARKIAIEVNGCYWHGCSECFKSGRFYTDLESRPGIRSNLGNDKRKRSYLAKHGWVLIEIWEHEWKADPTACVEQIKAGFSG